MFAQMFYVQWKWNRELLAFFVVLGFAIPLIVLWIVMPQLGVPSAREFIAIGQGVGVCCLSLSALSGVTIAWQGYGVDDAAGHTYALSLPVTRRRFLATRAAAAFMLLAIPALAIWLGAMLASANVSLPATLRTYSGALAMRALLAAWLAHSCMFALRYGAGRRSKVVLLVLLAALAVSTLAALVVPATRIALARLGDMLVSHPGPFGIFFGRWTLFDV
jgi:hypothetical protein